jgi:hypothetical protein
VAKETISDFFRQKGKATRPSTGTRESRKQEFLQALNKLFEQIQGELVDSDVEVDRDEIDVYEQSFGGYKAPRLDLVIGDEAVAFIPKGFNIVGAVGRVDVKGERGDGMLVLQPEGRWCVVQGTRPTLKLIPLTPESLLELLKEVMRA